VEAMVKHIEEAIVRLCGADGENKHIVSRK
jgi:hypothetical protein